MRAIRGHGLGFAVWVDSEEQVVWAQGTHEYRPMGAAVIAMVDRFRARDFRQSLKPPKTVQQKFVGFFGSLETVNEYLGRNGKRAGGWRRARQTPAHLL